MFLITFTSIFYSIMFFVYNAEIINKDISLIIIIVMSAIIYFFAGKDDSYYYRGN